MINIMSNLCTNPYCKHAKFNKFKVTLDKQILVSFKNVIINSFHHLSRIQKCINNGVI